MAQATSEWQAFLTKANQFFRSTIHPGAAELPVEGVLPALGGATQIVQRGDGCRGNRGRAGSVLHVCRAAGRASRREAQRDREQDQKRGSAWVQRPHIP